MKCENCNKEYGKIYGSGRFCSWECACQSSKKKRSKTKMTKCLECGELFEQKKHQKKSYCSKVCASKHPGFTKFNQNRKGKVYNEIYGTSELTETINKKKSQSLKKTINAYSKDKQEQISKIRSLVALKAGNGGYRQGSGRGKHAWYESKIAGRVFLDSSWELAYAQYLDQNNINWKRNTKTFSYVFESQNRNYTPDFYLVDSDEYIEVKGFKTEKDEAKWKYFPYKLKVLFKKDLISLGIKINRQVSNASYTHD